MSHFLKYGPDKGDGGVYGDGENFNIEKFSQMKWHTPNMYRRP